MNRRSSSRRQQEEQEMKLRPSSSRRTTMKKEIPSLEEVTQKVLKEEKKSTPSQKKKRMPTLEEITEKVLEERKKHETLKLKYLNKKTPIQILNENDEEVIFELSDWPSLFKEHNIMNAGGLVLQEQLLRIAPNALDDPIDLVSKKYQLDRKTKQNLKAQERLVKELKEEALYLVKKWRNLEDKLLIIDEEKNTYDVDLEELSRLWYRDLKHKDRFQRALEGRRIIFNWNFLDLLIDMQKELLYVRRRLENTITPEEEIKHWVNDSTGHMAMAKHLLNPGMLPEERAYVELHGELAKTGFGLMELQDFITLQQGIDYQQAVLEQSQINQEAKPMMTGHPIVLVHLVKEGVHGLERLRQLGQTIDPEDEKTRKLLVDYINA